MTQVEVDTLKKLQAFMERHGKNPMPSKKEQARREMILQRMTILIEALRG